MEKDEKEMETSDGQPENSDTINNDEGSLRIGHREIGSSRLRLR